MSMFYELMMRKKEEIMYATMKGSLTESPEGVFSGFSASNYLALQQTLDTSKSFEVVIKVRYVGDSNKYFFGKIGYSITVGTTTVDSNRRFKAFFSSNGTSWNIGNITTTVNLTTNTDYYVKVGFTGTKYYIEQSTDGKNYVGYAELNSSENIISGNLLLGKSYLDEQYWNGSIDLNNSYIKLGSTKYKLQAVVGYTVVGSPTITDGVVSGFTTSDYLTLGNRTLNLENIVFHTKFKTGTLQANTMQSVFMFGNYGSSYPVGITISNKKFLLFCAGNGNSGNVNITGATLEDNTEYEVEFRTKNTKRYCKFGKVGQMTDLTITWGSDTDFLGSITKYIWLGVIGINYNWAFDGGTIYLKDTWIKVDNKLWFNGQQS